MSVSNHLNHSMPKILWVLSCCLLNLSYACTGPASSPPPTATLPPLAQSPSTILGLTKAEWEQHHTMTDYEGSYVDNNDSNLKYGIDFWAYGTATDNSPIYIVSAALVPVLSDTLHIPTTYDVIHPVGGDLQRKAVVALLPADAQLVKTEPGVSEHDAFLDTFHSASLERRYPPIALIQDPWGTDPPGTIHVSYLYGVSPFATIHAGSNMAPQPTPTPYPTKTPNPTIPPGLIPTDIPTIPRPMPVPSWPVPVPSHASVAPVTTGTQATPSTPLKASTPPASLSPY
jgi:hypothetical protein